MIGEGAYYFPEDIKEIYKAYRELETSLEVFVNEMDRKSQTVSLLRLHRAITNYKSTVPKNMREKLTGILFE